MLFWFLGDYNNKRKKYVYCLVVNLYLFLKKNKKL